MRLRCPGPALPSAPMHGHSGHRIGKGLPRGTEGRGHSSPVPATQQTLVHVRCTNSMGKARHSLEVSRPQRLSPHRVEGGPSSTKPQLTLTPAQGPASPATRQRRPVRWCQAGSAAFPAGECSTGDKQQQDYFQSPSGYIPTARLRDSGYQTVGPDPACTPGPEEGPWTSC